MLPVIVEPVPRVTARPENVKVVVPESVGGAGKETVNSSLTLELPLET